MENKEINLEVKKYSSLASKDYLLDKLRNENKTLWASSLTLSILVVMLILYILLT